MIDFGVPETAEQHLDNSRSQKGKVSMTRDDICPEWEQKVATHVEGLISLGWKWEGRGLVPSFNAWSVLSVDSCDNNLETM